MHVLHLIEGLRTQDGGPVVSLWNLLKATDSAITHQVCYGVGAPDVLESFRPIATCVTPETLRSENAFTDVDLVHVHGMWSFHQAKMLLRASKRGIPAVISPRGMLEPWSLNQSPLKKRLFLSVIGNRALTAASAVHATADMEARNFPKFLEPHQIQVLPNIVEGPGRGGVPLWSASEGIHAVYLSRIHGKKGIFDLIPAWTHVFGGTPSTLTIYGPGETEDLHRLEMLLNQQPPDTRITYGGVVTGEAKAEAYRQADVFLLPSYSENYGNVIPEALSCGVPVLTTTGMPWGWLVETGAGWEIDPGEVALEGFLRELATLSAAQWAERKEAAHRVYETTLSPSHLGERYTRFYHSLVKPS